MKTEQTNIVYTQWEYNTKWQPLMLYQTTFKISKKFTLLRTGLSRAIISLPIISSLKSTEEVYLGRL